MAPITLTPLALGDEVRLRKPHPCGGFEWIVVRVGADIGLKCTTCGRRVLISRREFERRLDHVLRRATITNSESAQSSVDNS
ncbi:MAG: DUF951 domain-containing protein [Chloroflexi bacterium]|nr:DUF951 domain-containing protein [Chloroflexota bacterium]